MSRPNESLGWLTESSTQPRKAQPIRVTNSSVMSLKATLFETEEELKTLASSGDSKRRVARQANTGVDAFAKSNKGTHQRDQMAADQEAFEHVQRQERMRKKVELYHKLASGQVSVSSGGAAASLIDFEKKGWQHMDEHVATIQDGSTNSSDIAANSILQSTHIPAETISVTNPVEQERLQWEQKERLRLASGTDTSAVDGSVLSAYHKTLTRVEKKMLEEVELETDMARKQFASMKSKRQAELDHRRNKLELRKKKRKLDITQLLEIPLAPKEVKTPSKDS